MGRVITEAVKATQVVVVTESYPTAAEAEKAITEGTVRAALVLPSDLSQRIVQQRTVGQWLVDGSDTMISSALLQLQTMPLQDLLTYQPPAEPTFDVALYFNPSRRSAVNIVPGSAWRYSDDDNDTVYLGSNSARAGAGQPGAIDHHTGTFSRADDCEDYSLYFCRTHSGWDHPWVGAFHI